MLELLVEVAPELAAVSLFGLGATLLTVAGVLIERFALALVESGNVKLGAWAAFVGAMAFYFGPYLLGYHETRPRLRRLQARVSDRRG